MSWLGAVSRWLPASVRPLASVLFDTVHPRRSPALVDWHAEGEPVVDVAYHLGIDDPVVVDGGAHLGQSIQRFQRAFARPVIHAFEPVPEHVEALRARYGTEASVTIHPVALGPTDGTVEFLVNHKTATSSVLPITRPYRLVGFTTDARAYTPREAITVEQTTLDAALPPGVDILKLDLQGYEREALSGGEAVLAECTAVITEVAFIEYYRDQALFPDVWRFLRDHGFVFYRLYNSKYESDGRLGVADAVFFDGAFAAGLQPIRTPGREG